MWLSDSMRKKADIDGEKYDYNIISAVTGEKEPREPKEWQKMLAYVAEHPEELPFYLEKLIKIKKSRELRLALVRLQIMSDLHMSENMELYQMCTYVAETIEHLIYGSLALEKGFEEKSHKKNKNTKKKKDKKGD